MQSLHVSADLHFSQLKTEQGLPMIRALHRDNNGFLWIGTDGVGLFRYDGYSLKPYQPDSSISGSISSNRIVQIFQDSKGYIWFSTRDGLNKYDVATDSFEVYHFNKDDGTSISNDLVYCTYEDSNGQLWVGSYKGLFLWDDELNDFIKINFIGEERNQQVTSIVEGDHNLLWICTYENGIYSYIHSDKKLMYYSNPGQSEELGTYKRLLLDKNNTIWIGTEGLGLWSFNLDQHQYTNYKEQSGNSGLSGNLVMGVLEEDERYLLIAIDQGGLNRLDRQTGKIEHILKSDSKYNLSTDGILCLHKDDEDILWLGSSRGGVEFYNPARYTFQTKQQRNVSGRDLNSSNGLIYNHVGCFFEDNKGRIWVGTDGGGISVFDTKEDSFKNYVADDVNKGLVSNTIRSIAQDADGIIWILTWEKGLCKFNPQKEIFINDDAVIRKINKISSRRGWSMYIDAQDRLWFSSIDGSVRMMDKQTGKIQNYHLFKSKDDINSPLFYEHNKSAMFAVDFRGVYRYNEANGAFDQLISLSNSSCMHIDTDNHFWVGTLDKGVFVFNKEGELIKKYTKDNGLSDNFIYGILEGKKGEIWISTNNGLNRYVQDAEKITSFSQEDGIQGNQFFFQSFYKTPDGILYFGGTNGFSYFDPNQVVQQVSDFKSYFSSIEVDNEKRNWLDVPGGSESGIVLSRKASILLVKFNAISFTYPLKNLFKYKLEGFDKEWVLSDVNDRTAKYTNLDPGDYIFKVQVANSSGVWSTQDSKLQISIPIPFWQKTWFYIITIIFIVGIVYGVVKFRIYKLKRDRKRLQEKVFERTKIIQNQNEELERHRSHLEELVQTRTKELVTAKEKAEESNRLKTAFLQNMSHEIRTPMNGILGFTNLLSEPNLSPIETQRYIHVINKSGERLMNTINDIVDISVIEAKQVSLNFESFELGSVLYDMIDFFEMKVEEKGLKLLLDCDASLLQKQVIADKTKLNSILSNLIKNAIKFTHKGEVTIGVEEQVSQLQFIIKDTGIGIPDNRKEAIFNRFEKADIEDEKVYEGSGLGLAIAKAFVEILGGKICLESKVNKGSTFYFTIPLNNEMS